MDTTVIIHEFWETASFAETGERVGVLACSADQSTVVCESVAIKIWEGGANFHTRSVGSGQSKFAVRAGINTQSGTRICPKVGRAVVKASPVALVPEKWRTCRAHAQAQISQVVRKGISSASLHTESVDGVCISEGIDWAPQNTSVGGIVTKSSLLAHCVWALVDT